MVRRSRSPLSAALALTLCVVALPASAGQIVQSGSLSGAGAPMTQPLVLAAFDDQGGSLVLTAVHLEALTAIGGGYQTDGSGIAVDVEARLRAEYSFGGTLLVATEAIVDITVANTGPPIAVSVFGNDTDEATIVDPTALAAWVGGPGSTVTLDVFTEFTIVENPPGVIFFGAGGTVQYTLTYEFEVAPDETFERGDTNGDGSIDIADPIALLAELFGPGPATACPDAADTNDDGTLNIADAVYALSALFAGGDDPPPPFGACGPDPTADALDCPAAPACP